MNNKIKNIFFFIIFSFFSLSVIYYYFSDKNIINTNKSRVNYSIYLNQNLDNIPLLTNDTENIIEYTDDIEKYKKSKKRYKFFDLLKD